MNFGVFGIFKGFLFYFKLILKEIGPNRFGRTEPARRRAQARPVGLDRTDGWGAARRRAAWSGESEARGSWGG